MATESEIKNQQDMDDEEDSMWQDDEDCEPEYYHCQSCGKTFLEYPGSNPYWDGSCSIDGIG